jgi:signal recognition particle receptor subunit beta
MVHTLYHVKKVPLYDVPGKNYLAVAVDVVQTFVIVFVHNYKKKTWSRSMIAFLHKANPVPYLAVGLYWW